MNDFNIYILNTISQNTYKPVLKSHILPNIKLTACCQQTGMTYIIAACTVKNSLMMDRGTVRNM